MTDQTETSEHNTATDPVCGMTIDPDQAAGTETYAGKTRFFCSRKCAVTFDKHPDKYTGDKGAEKKQASSADARIYTCPMHPEVEQQGPGDCPKCGMDLEPNESGGGEAAGEAEQQEARKLSRRFWFSLVCTLPVFVIGMSHMLPGKPLSSRFDAGTLIWIQGLLATPVVCYGGSIFFRRAWRSLRTFNLNMFTLIGMGTGVAYVYSLIATLAPDIFRSRFVVRTGLSKSVSSRRR